jgi:glutamine synthetase
MAVGRFRGAQARQGREVEFVRFWFTDIFGQLKSFAIGKDELEDAFADGMGFDGSSITGFNRIEESDMIAMPDPGQLPHPPLARQGPPRWGECSATS